MLWVFRIMIILSGHRSTYRKVNQDFMQKIHRFLKLMMLILMFFLNDVNLWMQNLEKLGVQFEWALWMNTYCIKKDSFQYPFLKGCPLCCFGKTNLNTKTLKYRKSLWKNSIKWFIFYLNPDKNSVVMKLKRHWRILIFYK